MTRRLILAAIVGLCAALYEVGAVSFFPPWAGFRPLMPLIVLALVTGSRSRAVAMAVGGALVLDAYALDRFDFALVRLPAAAFFLAFVSERFLTNRSVYATAALALCGRLFDWMSAWALGWLAFLLDLHGRLWASPPAPLAVLAWDAIGVSVAFFLLAVFSGRFLTRPDTPYAAR